MRHQGKKYKLVLLTDIEYQKASRKAEHYCSQFKRETIVANLSKNEYFFCPGREGRLKNRPGDNIFEDLNKEKENYINQKNNEK